jgi:hypothetical protein
MSELDSTFLWTIVAAVFTLGGFVKGVVGLGLPTITMGLLSVVMLPAQAAALLVGALARHEPVADRRAGLRRAVPAAVRHARRRCASASRSVRAGSAEEAGRAWRSVWR